MALGMGKDGPSWLPDTDEGCRKTLPKQAVRLGQRWMQSWDERSTEGVLTGLGLVLALLVVIPVLNHRNTNQLNEDAVWVAHTQEVLGLTADVLLTLVDAETGQRGFVITGKDDFLQPYNAALVRLDERLAKLRGYPVILSCNFGYLNGGCFKGLGFNLLSI